MNDCGRYTMEYFGGVKRNEDYLYIMQWKDLLHILSEKKNKIEKSMLYLSKKDEVNLVQVHTHTQTYTSACIPKRNNRRISHKTKN